MATARTTVLLAPELRKKETSDHSANRHEVLQKLFISALNDDSDETWGKILNLLDSLPPIQLTELITQPEIRHYIIRTLSSKVCLEEGNQNSITTRDVLIDKLYKLCHDIEGKQILKERKVEKEENRECKDNQESKKKIKRQRSVTYSHPYPLPAKSLYLYDRKCFPVTFRDRKVTTTDIVASCDRVRLEALTLEVSKRPLLPPLPKRPQTSTNSSQRLCSLEPLFISDFPPYIPGRKHGPVKHVEPRSVLKQVLKAQVLTEDGTFNSKCHLQLKTAEDVIHAFASGAIPSDKQEVYMTFTDTVPWNPYKLTVTEAPNPLSPYFVATVFGILLIYPDGECEHRSFAEWYRDKMVFHLICKIKIFHEYLLRKMIRIWAQNVSQIRFNRSRDSSYSSGVLFHSPFSQLAWQINSLSVDLLSLVNINYLSARKYTLEEYSFIKKNNSKRLLHFFHKYFKYCLESLNQTFEETHDYVHALEVGKSHRPFVSDLPISVQKHEHEDLEKKLQSCIHRKTQLVSLERLVREIVRSTIISFVEGHTLSWLSCVLYEEREVLSKEVSQVLTEPCSLWRGELTLNEGILECSPNVNQLESLLLDPLVTTIQSINKAYHDVISKDNEVDCLSVSSVHNDCELSLMNDSVRNDLEKDPVLVEAKEKLSVVVEKVKEDLMEFCHEAEWLTLLYQYLIKWEEIKKQGQDEIKPEEIKSALTDGSRWLFRISQLPLYFTTAHTLITVTTDGLLTSIRPRLSAIVEWIQNYGIQTICHQTDRLTKLTKEHIEILSTKRYDLERFAFYSQQLVKLKERRDKEKETLQFIFSLLDTLTISGIIVSDSVKSLVKEMESAWESCEDSVSQASFFVTTQTPLKAQGLKESMEVRENEVFTLVQQVNSQPFTDSYSTCSDILMKINEVALSVLSAQSQLADLAKWRRAITGEQYDMTDIKNAMDRLNGRKEIWRALQNFNNVEREWLTKSFKKLNTEDMDLKLLNWIKLRDNLIPLLPVNDPVLVSFSDHINDYHQLMPVLKKLTSPSVKSFHWNTLLSAVEVDYDPARQYSLQDLFLYKLLSPDNTQVITDVCHLAEREATLRLSVETLQQKWECRTFCLEKISYEEVAVAFSSSPHFSLPLPPPSISSPTEERDRVTKFALASSSQSSSSDGNKSVPIVKVIDGQEVLVDLEDDITHLQVLHASPHIQDTLRHQLDHWCTILKQLRELIDLLVKCQTQWFGVIAILNGIPAEDRSSYKLDTLHSVSAQYQELMKHLSEDCMILSLLERKRGQKGYRDLQGDALRQSLEKTLNGLELFVDNVESLIVKEAKEFPRLLTLPRQHQLHALNHQNSTHPVFLLPTLSLLFPHVSDLSVIEFNTPVDLLDNSPQEDGYQIISVHDVDSFPLSLCVPLSLGKRKTVKWLEALERAIRYSLACHVTKVCTGFPRQLLGAVEIEEDDVSVMSWLTDNVSQAILLAVECKWSLSVKTAHESSSLTSIKLQFERIIDYLVHLLNSTRSSLDSTYTYPDSTLSKITSLLSALITSAKHKLDLIDTQTYPHILYQIIEPSQAPTRLGSLPTSVTSSRTSISQTIRLQTLPGSIAGSTKSLATSRVNLTGTIRQGQMSSITSSTKSLLPSIPNVPTYCNVQCNYTSTDNCDQLMFGYGYEFYGSSFVSSVLYCPPVERCTVHLMKCITDGAALVDGSIGKESAMQISKILGRPYYILTCASFITPDTLLSTLLSSLQSGSILTLQSIDTLPLTNQLLLMGYIKDIYEAIKVSMVVSPVFTKSPVVVNIPAGSRCESPGSTPSLNSHNDYKSCQSTGSRLTIGPNRMDWYSTHHSYGSSLLGNRTNIELYGETYNVNSFFGCIGVIDRKESITEDMKVSFRTVQVEPLNMLPVLESFICSYGLYSSIDVGKQLYSCLKELEVNGILKCSLPLIKLLFSHYIKKHINLSNRECIKRGLLDLTCGLEEIDKDIAIDIISKKLNIVKEEEETQECKSDELLIRAIKKELEERHLQAKPEIIDKVLELDRAIQCSSRRCVLLIGPSCSGKSTLYETLAQAYHRLSEEGGEDKKKERVYMYVLNPEAYTMNELFGGFSSSNSGGCKSWSPGIVTQVLQHIVSANDRHQIHHKTLQMDPSEPLSVLPTTINYWIVLNGYEWRENQYWLENLLIEPHTLCLPNNDILTLPSHCRIIIETSTLPYYTPSTSPPLFLTNSILIHCTSLITSQDLTVSWLQRGSIKHNIPTKGVECLSYLMDTLLPALFEYVNDHGNNLSVHIGSHADLNLHLVSSFLSLLSAVLDRHSPKHDDSSSSIRRGGSSALSTRTVSRIDSMVSLQSTGMIGGGETDLSKSFSGVLSLTEQLSSGSVLMMGELDSEGKLFSNVTELESFNQQYLMTTMFIFAAIWSFGSYISNSHYESFSDKIRELISMLPTGQDLLPTTGLVFDYYLDLKTHRFMLWADRKRDSATSSSSHSHSYIVIPELERFSYLTDLYLSSGSHVLLVGDQGCGKSSFLKRFIQSRMTASNFQIASSLSSSTLQSSILSRFNQLKKRQTTATKKSPLVQRATYIFDDIHLASSIFEHKFKASPSFSPIVHLLSHVAEYGTLYEGYRSYPHSLTGVRLVGTCTLSGVINLNPSLLRHMSVVPFISLSNEGLIHILTLLLVPMINRLSINSLKLQQQLETDCVSESLAHVISVATLILYRNMRKRFIAPSPTHPHFHYSLHHLYSLAKGMIVLSNNTNSGPSIVGGASQLSRRKAISGKGSLFGDAIPKRERTGSRVNRTIPRGSMPSSRLSGVGGSRELVQTGCGSRMLPPLVESAVTKRRQPSSLPQQTTLPPIKTTTARKTSSRGSTTGSRYKSLSLTGGSDNYTVLLKQEEEGEDKVVPLLRVLFRLWCHESSRVFVDRLSSGCDREWFIKVLEVCLKYCYCGADIVGAAMPTKDGELGGGSRRVRPGRLTRQHASTSTSTAGSGPIITITELNDNKIDEKLFLNLLPKEKQHKFIEYNHLTMRGEDLSACMFAALPKVQEKVDNESEDEEEEAEKKKDNNLKYDYVEVGEGQLRDVLSDLILNKEEFSHVLVSRSVLDHVSHLCRAMVVPGTHVMLVGPQGTGRKTNTLLAAGILKIPVYMIKAENYKSLMKEACTVAGIEDKRVVILVDGLKYDDHAMWNGLLESMRDGLPSNLFTSSELLVMGSKLLSGKVHARRTAEMVHQSLSQAIRPNLHIIITWNTPPTSNEIFQPTLISDIYCKDENDRINLHIMEEQKQSLFAIVSTNTQYIEHYSLNSKDTLSEIALEYWQSPKVKDTHIYTTDCSTKLEELSYLAAHIHLSFVSLLQYIGGAQSIIGWVGTMREYRQSLELGFNLALDLKKEKQEIMSKLNKGTGNYFDLGRKRDSLESMVTKDLKPKLEQAEINVQNHMGKITAARQYYMAASKKCKDAQDIIDRESKEVSLLKTELDNKFEEVSPIHFSALETLSSVDRSVVLEVMGYRSPPGPLLPVFEALCLLFDRPATWTDCQQLMLSQHFFQSLKFFDKDKVPKAKLKKLEKLLADQEKLGIDKVSDASQAVVPLVLWITALVDYRNVQATLYPYNNRLAHAEDTLKSAQEVYVDMRQEMLETKATLEETVDNHKEAVKKAKAIEGELKSVQGKLQSVEDLVQCILRHKEKWGMQHDQTKNDLYSIAAHSLLVSASCTYLGLLPPEYHCQLWENWLLYCKGQVDIGCLTTTTGPPRIIIPENFNSSSVLATEEERLVWEREETFPDKCMLEKCLQWRTVSHYGAHYTKIVFDPLNVYPQYIKGLSKEDKNNDIHYLSDLDPHELVDQLETAAKEGHQVAILLNSLPDINSEPIPYNILLPLLLTTSSASLIILGKKIVPKPKFTVYVVLPVSPFSPRPHPLVSFLIQHTPGLCLTSLIFSQESLSNLFLKYILHCLRRELCIQHRALIADISLHQKQVTKNQEAILSRIAKTKWSFDDSQALQSFVQETEGHEETAANHVKEAYKALDDIKLQSNPYMSLSNHMAVVFLSYTRLASNIPHVDVGLSVMFDVLKLVISEGEGTRFHLSQTSLVAYLHHLELSLTDRLYTTLTPHLFNDYIKCLLLIQVLYKDFPPNQKSHERTLLLNPLPLSLQSLLDDIMFSTSNNARDSTNETIAGQECISKAQVLEYTVPMFSGLVSSLQTNRAQWQEYFNQFTSLLLPVPPPLSNSLTLSQKLLLWKTIEPNQFHKAIESYINLTLGPQFNRSHIFNIPSLIPTHQLIFLLFDGQLLLNDVVKVANKRGIPIVELSALKEKDIERRINELLMKSLWLIVDHLYHMPPQWIETVIKVKKCLDLKSFQKNCDSNFHCFIPLSMSHLLLLKSHITLSSCYVIALPTVATPITKSRVLQKYHMIIGDENIISKPLPIEELKLIVTKIHSLLPSVSEARLGIYDSQSNDNTDMDIILNKAHSSLILIQTYLQGNHPYTALIGLTINSLLVNEVPVVWPCELIKDHNGDRITALTDFIHWIRQLYYY